MLVKVIRHFKCLEGADQAGSELFSVIPSNFKIIDNRLTIRQHCHNLLSAQYKLRRILFFDVGVVDEEMVKLLPHRDRAVGIS